MPILLNGRCYKTFKGAQRAWLKSRRMRTSKANMKRAGAYVATVERRQRGTKTLRYSCPRGHAGKARVLPWRRKKARHVARHHKRRSSRPVRRHAKPRRRRKNVVFPKPGRPQSKRYRKQIERLFASMLAPLRGGIPGGVRPGQKGRIRRRRKSRRGGRR
jgi:hypothetical protein